MEIFYREKNISRREKNQEKWLSPLRKIFPLGPWLWRSITYFAMVFGKILVLV